MLGWKMLYRTLGRDPLWRKNLTIVGFGYEIFIKENVLGKVWLDGLDLPEKKESCQ